MSWTAFPVPGKLWFAVLSGLILFGISPAPAAEPTFRKTISYRAQGRDETGELRWDAAARTLTLHDAAGQQIPWPDTLALNMPGSSSVQAGAVEPHDDTVAVLSARERLTGRLRSVRDRDEVVWSIGDSLTETKVDAASAFAWAIHPGKSTLLFRSFEDPANAATFEPTPPAADGRRMLRLAGTRRETLIRSSAFLMGRALFQVAFEELPAANENGPLTLSLFTGSMDKPAVSVRLVSKDDLWELTSPVGDQETAARIPRTPGIHRLGILLGEGRVRFCIDASVAFAIRAASDVIPVRAVELSAETGKPRAVDALGAFVFGPATNLLQWPLDDDSLVLAGGSEWLGKVKSLAGGTWTAVDGDRQREIPLGLTETWVPPARQGAFRWVSGPVMEVTFLHSGGSTWNVESADSYFGSLGLLALPPKGHDRVEGVIEACDENGLVLALSQGGSLVVPFDRLAALKPAKAAGLRIVDARPRHLGDDIDLKVVPPNPLGNRLELSFDVTAEQAGWPIELAVDALEVLGFESPRFGHLISKGELITEVRLNGVSLGSLNEKVSPENETMERVRFAIPAGTLKAGTNRIEFRQKGLSNDPNYLDDLSILGVRLYRMP